MRGIVQSFEPAFVAPYKWALMVIVAVTVLWAVLLSWRLFGSGLRREIRFDRVLDGSVSSDDLGRAALANRVSHAALSGERLARVRTGPRVDLDSALRTLRGADARFDYLWRRLAIGVSSMRSMMRLTLVAAAIMTVHGFFPSWNYFSYDNATSATIAGLPASTVRALSDAVQDTLARLTAGLGVAGGLCIVAMAFDGLLQHRLASWKYLYATVHDALSGGKPLE